MDNMDQNWGRVKNSYDKLDEDEDEGRICHLSNTW